MIGDREGAIVIETNYEVIRFVEHGGRCWPTMDCVKGQLLLYRLKGQPVIEKAMLFSWMKELLTQLEQYQRCRNNKGYRYMNPYSVLVTDEDKLLLLDLEAESNAFVMKNLQKQAVRSHFVKPIVRRKHNVQASMDLYGYGKTIQFIMANTEMKPALTRKEIYQIEKLIDKCIGETMQKQYDDLSQVYRDMPYIRERKGVQIKKYVVVGMISMVLIGYGVFMTIQAENFRMERDGLIRQLRQYSEEQQNEAGIEENVSDKIQKEN